MFIKHPPAAQDGDSSETTWMWIAGHPEAETDKRGDEQQISRWKHFFCENENMGPTIKLFLHRPAINW